MCISFQLNKQLTQNERDLNTYNEMLKSFEVSYIYLNLSYFQIDSGSYSIFWCKTNKLHQVFIKQIAV